MSVTLNFTTARTNSWVLLVNPTKFVINRPDWRYDKPLVQEESKQLEGHTTYGHVVDDRS